MKKYLLLVLFISAISKCGTAQFIDNYGLNIGASYSNQLWDYKRINVENPGEEYKPGLLIFLSAEKKLNKIFSIRPEIGYIQKGFKDNTELRFSDGTSAGANNGNLVLHDLALNVGLKFTPFNIKWTPYALIGLCGDYMLSYKDVVIIEENTGLEFRMYEPVVDKFNKATLGGLLGIGFEINDLLYFEIEYNPAITSNLNDDGLEIKDNCWGAKFGFNINQLRAIPLFIKGD